MTISKLKTNILLQISKTKHLSLITNDVQRQRVSNKEKLKNTKLKATKQLKSLKISVIKTYFQVKLSMHFHVKNIKTYSICTLKLIKGCFMAKILEQTRMQDSN